MNRNVLWTGITLAVIASTGLALSRSSGGDHNGPEGRDRGDCFGITCDYPPWYRTQIVQGLPQGSPVPLPRPRPKPLPVVRTELRPVGPTLDRLDRISALAREIEATARSAIRTIR